MRSVSDNSLDLSKCLARVEVTVKELNPSDVRMIQSLACVEATVVEFIAI